uniref:TIDP3357 n=1 Tax=Arundo donax TaxID=35708 RepID=A0A0A9EMX9_ARUDO
MNCCGHLTSYELLWSSNELCAHKGDSYELLWSSNEYQNCKFRNKGKKNSFSP